MTCKPVIVALCLLISFHCFSQIAVSKIVGKDSKDFRLGYGGFLKFAFRVSDASDVTFEGGANIFQFKNDNSSGWATVPLKLGYRYTLNGSGTGFYVEPQAGYNVYGVDPDDNVYKGLILAGGAGYIFNPAGLFRFDLGLLFESSQHKGGAVNYVSLRLVHSFQFGRRNEED